jgi:hypothetical protein
MGKGFGVAIGLLHSVLLLGQNIGIDRPDYTESPNLTESKHLQLETGIRIQHGLSPNLNARIRLGLNAELRCLAGIGEGIELGGKWVYHPTKAHRLGLVAGVNPLNKVGRFIFAAEHDLPWGIIAWNLGGMRHQKTTTPFATLGGTFNCTPTLQVLHEAVLDPTQWSSIQWNFGAIWHPKPTFAVDLLVEPPWSKPFWTMHLGYTTAFRLSRSKPEAPR